MLFINTRPSDRAQQLTQALQAEGVDVLELPLLALEAMPWSESLAHLFARIDRVGVIVVVSPAAVTFGMQALAQAGGKLEDLRHIQWIAVGQATAQALLQYGFESHVPEVETSEGMLSLPVLQYLDSSAQIAFWRGEGGRQFMMDTLSTQGIQVLNFVLYRRDCPVSAAQTLQAHLDVIREVLACVLLITSEASWNNWLRLAQHYSFEQTSMYCFVLAERVTRLVEQSCHEHQLDYQVIQLEDLKQDTILKQLHAVQGNT